MLSFTSHLSVPGCSLRYRDSGGAGPAVVFLHGAGADHVMFIDQAETLNNDGRRVVLLDMRGHGQSRPNSAAITAEQLMDDVESLVAALALERPVLVGHSLGGNLGQALVRRSPHAYSGLAVLDSTWNTGPLNWVERQMLRLAAPGLSLIPAAKFPHIMAAASATTEPARQDAERAFSQVTKRDFLEIWRATTTFVDPDPSYRTPVPLCLIRGAEDRTGNIASAMPAWARHEGVSELVVPDAGHLVSQDAAGAVTAELMRFLATNWATK
ncbi:alpha/beta fold hydrolase [Rhodococcus sp. NPDC060090]|uniref:alpha/beta fold hydrolase n=1 Tax=Rhodococcus sp. NPDC060090 TaxID=3347056 RepID=UPI00364AD1C3